MHNDTETPAAKQPDFKSWPHPTGLMAAATHIMNAAKSIAGMPGMPGDHKESNMLGIGAVWAYMEKKTGAFTDAAGKFDSKAFMTAHGITSPENSPTLAAIPEANLKPEGPQAVAAAATTDYTSRATKLGATVSLTPRGMG